jgi:hypothetical protein
MILHELNITVDFFWKLPLEVDFLGTSGKRAFASFYGPSLIEGINFG